jgi:hypothetical protein
MPRRGSAGNQAFPFCANADISYLRSKCFTLQELRENVDDAERVCTFLYSSTSAAHLRYLQRMKELDVINDISQVTIR